MPTLVNSPAPAEFERLLERRRALGQDRYDEVWEGVYHMNPSPHPRHGRIAQKLAVIFDAYAAEAGLVPLLNTFNLGEDSQNYRVPDGGLFHSEPDQIFMPTAALVVEIVSPDDETWNKLDFYAAHQVSELLIVDPQKREIHWLALRGREYQPITRSALIGLGPDELAERLDWPRR